MIFSRPFNAANLNVGSAYIQSDIGHTNKDNTNITTIESQNFGKGKIIFVVSANSIAAKAEPTYIAYIPIGERINTVMPIVIIKITILKNQCSSMPINSLGKLILSKLLNDTANEINVGIRINDQSHLMQTRHMMLAKTQESDVIAILII